MKLCPNCGKEITENSKFCSFCGSKLNQDTYRLCPICKTQIPSNSKFCMHCGSKITTEETKNKIETNSKFILWNIQPEQLAVKIEESDLSAYAGAEGLIVKEGTKALLFQDGKFASELESGTYDFGSKAFNLGKTMRGTLNNFFNCISDFFKGIGSHPTNNRNFISESNRKEHLYSFVLVRTVSFPLLFTLNDIKTGNVTSNIGLHLSLHISNINKLYTDLLQERKSIYLSSLASGIEDVVKDTTDIILANEDAQTINHNPTLRENLKNHLQNRISEVYPFITLDDILSLTNNNKDLEKIEQLKSSLYISELELKETIKRNEYIERSTAATYKHTIKNSQANAELSSILEKIDEQKIKTEDERAKYNLLIDSQKKIREAKSQEEIDTVLNEIRKSQLFRDSEITEIEHMYAQKTTLQDLEYEQVLAMKTIANQKAQDEARLNWEESIGNRRLENKLSNKRKEDTYEMEKRKAEIQLDREEQLKQLDLLKAAQEIREKREEAKHSRDMETLTLEKESLLERTKLLGSMSPEQIMLINPDITKEAAMAMAEKFKAEALVASKSEITEALKNQNTQMTDFMTAQLESIKEMSISMNNSKEDDHKKELEKINDTANKHEEQLTKLMQTVVQHTNSTDAVKKCPKCGAQNPSNSMFCQECGKKL